MSVRQSWFAIFKLLPTSWLFDLCMYATPDTRGRAISEGEFIWYIGLWILMATCCGWSKAKFWDCSVDNPCTNPMPYQCSQFFAKICINQITYQLCWTKKASPPTEFARWWDYEIKTWLFLFWILCLDKSISIWFQQWTCPGWAFCPCKPQPYGKNTTLYTVVCLEFFWLR